jgi:hypothetical protein
VHIYAGEGATVPGTVSQDQLWYNLDVLRKYDMVMFPCNSVADSSAASAFQNVFAYVNEGGRVFATDLSYPWFKQGPQPFPSTAEWIDWRGLDVQPLPALVDQSFPKGAALAEWLRNIGATTVTGQMDLFETYHVVNEVTPPTTRWLYSAAPATVQLLSFNAPVDVHPEEQCGRAVYSNFHIAHSTGGFGRTFPAECDSAALTPQEKVLEFLLFDLASCVQDDTTPPRVPR